MHKRGYVFILISMFILFFCIRRSEKTLLISLCIILETGLFFALFKTQIKTAVFFSIFLCFLVTIGMIIEIVTKVNGKEAILNEINKALNILTTNFIVVMVICIGEILIIKKVRKWLL